IVELCSRSVRLIQRALWALTYCQKKEYCFDSLYAMGRISMAKRHLRLISPATINRTVAPRRPPNRNLRTREYLTEAEVERLMKAATRTRWGHRDSSMVLVAYRHGLRAAELVDLRWDQVDFRTATLHVRRVKQGTPSTHPTYEGLTGCSELTTGPFPRIGLSRYDVLSLRLGGGKETAQQSGSQHSKNATPQDGEVPQCAKGDSPSQFPRCRQRNKSRAAHPRTRRSAGAPDSELGGTQGHQLVARRAGASVRGDAGELNPHLRGQVWYAVPLRKRCIPRGGHAQRTTGICRIPSAAGQIPATGWNSPRSPLEDRRCDHHRRQGH